jgi:hypothetical protein
MSWRSPRKRITFRWSDCSKYSHVSVQPVIRHARKPSTSANSKLPHRGEPIPGFGLGRVQRMLCLFRLLGRHRVAGAVSVIKHVRLAMTATSPCLVRATKQCNTFTTHYP